MKFFHYFSKKRENQVWAKKTRKYKNKELYTHKHNHKHTHIQQMNGVDGVFGKYELILVIQS